MKILVCGGAGFIGSAFIKNYLKNNPTHEIKNLDSLIIGSNLKNLKEIEKNSNYEFIKDDIKNQEIIEKQTKEVDVVVNFAAESHVDRSIANPRPFIETNIVGTYSILEAIRKHDKQFIHVSTDEIYGDAQGKPSFNEDSQINPSNPYAATKAAADHLVASYHRTYGINCITTRCTNNFGQNQFPEKLIPLCINNILNEKPLPIYGDGKFTRDWLFVKDHAEAIDQIFHKGKTAETYNVGGFNEWRNIDLVKLLCDLTDDILNREKGTAQRLITFVKDRPGHDKRYAIDASKISNELQWKPSVTLEEGLKVTIKWYIENKDWLENVVSGEYQSYYQKQYNSKT